MNENELLQMRWLSLGIIGVKYEYIKKYIHKNYSINISEPTLEEFSKIAATKYAMIDQQNLLFELEDITYRKISIFTMREKELEELDIINRNMFLAINRLDRLENHKELTNIDSNVFPCYIAFGGRFITIKMAQIRRFLSDNLGENGELITNEIMYYHWCKFIIDLENRLVFLFYNDIHTAEDNNKGIAITEKKQCFYKLFRDGNQQTLNSYRFDRHLNNYIKDYLEELKEEEASNPSVILIETIDPIDTKNNLRSSKSDGRHNEYRLKAIKFAIEKEEHTVKTMECMIQNRWYQFKNTGEIIAKGPYFSREDIENVCKEVFPEYKLPSKDEAAEQATI